MRRSLLLAFTAITLFITGCKEDFELAAPYKDITLVHAMLDMDSVVNYVRIQKAFLSQDLSAIDMSKVPDSSFYADGAIDVQIKEILPNGTVRRTHTLVRTQVADKQAGEFFTSPNYAYKYDRSDVTPVSEMRMNKNNIYRLVIKNNATGDMDSSETRIVNADTTNADGPITGNFHVYILRSETDPAHDSDPLDFNRLSSSSAKTDISVITPLNSAIIEGFIRFYYWEKDLVNGSEVQKYFDFPLPVTPTKPTPSTTTITTLQEQLRAGFVSGMGPAPETVQRFMDDCELFLYAKTSDYVDYSTLAGLLGSSGLTSNEIKPTYSNIKGKDAYGLFSSRAFRWGRHLPISSRTLDSLNTNPITSPLRIQKQRSDK